MESSVIVEATHKSMDNYPLDILHMIGSRLWGKDRICFRSVCKTWRSAISSLPSPNKMSLTKVATRFPLLMYYGLDDSFRTFYHPIYNTTYVMNTPTLANSRILFSKDGWLIMSRGKAEIFFNPIINKRIDLPDIPDIRQTYTTISFSSLPTSPDCIVICVIWSIPSSHFFNIIRRGETEWTTYNFENNVIDFFGSGSNPVFNNGLFYYLDRKGLLGTFDPAQNSWTILANPKQPCNNIHRNYLVECDGDLISAFMGRHNKWINVFKLDPPTMTWKKLEKLGDKMLFVSRTTSLSATTSKQEFKGMENKIFFPRFWGDDEDIIFYSLNTCKFHSLGSYNSDDIYNTTIKLLSTWVNPTTSHTFFDDEFHW